MAFKNFIKEVNLPEFVCGLEEMRNTHTHTKIMKTFHEPHVLKTLLLWPAWIWVGPGLTYVWPGLGQGQALAQIPPLHSHICHSRPGGGRCVI